MSFILIPLIGLVALSKLLQKEIIRLSSTLSRPGSAKTAVTGVTNAAVLVHVAPARTK